MEKVSLFTVFILALLTVGVVSAAGPPAVSEGDIHGFGLDPREPGPGASATLTRYNGAVQYNITTNNLDAGAAYTNWWIIWNDPSECNGACDGGDLFIAGNSILWATGRVLDNEGNAQFSALLHENSFPGQVLFGSGLTDAENAEIHVVIQAHGQVNPTLVYDQTHYEGAGCNPTCVDQQAVAFPVP
jgi:hypothetical protein